MSLYIPPAFAVSRQLRPSVFINAPHVLNPVDPATDIERVNIDGPEKLVDPILTPRGWWTKADSGKAESHATGLEASLEYLRDYLAHEHFDVCSWITLFVRTYSNLRALKGYLRFQVCNPILVPFSFSDVSDLVKERR